MNIFLDTADRDFIKKMLPTGLVDGITTNPSILSKAGGDVKALLADICAMVPGPVSIEAVEKEPEAMFKQALRIAAFAKNAVVKIPFMPDYVPVIKRLVVEGVTVNVTLIFSPLQGMMAAKLGAQYISPYVGRWDDAGADGLELLEQTVDLNNLHDAETLVLAASIRSVLQWQKAALVGADIVTVPPAIFEQALMQPLSERGMRQFDEDWQRAGALLLL
jgi:transaldolase